MTQLSWLAQWRWRLLAGAALALALAFFAVTWWQGPQVVAEAVLRRDLVQTVVASGHVEAVEVKLDVGQPPAVLRQDMTVLVDLEVARRPQTLVVCAACVRDADSAAPWVLRLRNQQAEKVAVQLGLRSGAWVEVLQGLQAEDLLVSGASGATTVQAGDRVRAQVASTPTTPSR